MKALILWNVGGVNFRLMKRGHAAEDFCAIIRFLRAPRDLFVGHSVAWELGLCRTEILKNWEFLRF